ncbi:hypothetical protein YC2023_059198 [Brassica napus]
MRNEMHLRMVRSTRGIIEGYGFGRGYSRAAASIDLRASLCCRDLSQRPFAFNGAGSRLFMKRQKD